MFKLTWRKLVFIFAIVLALLPVAISSFNMIGITSDELKSNTNAELGNITGQIATHIDNLYQYNWLGPLRLVKNGVENNDIGPNEKAALIAAAAQNITDLALITLYFRMEDNSFAEAVSVKNDGFEAMLKAKGMSFQSAVRFDSAGLSAFEKSRKNIWLAEPEYLAGIGEWVISVYLRVNIQGLPPGILAAKMDLTSLHAYMRGHYYNKTGSVYLIDSTGSQLFDTAHVDVTGLKVVQDARTLIRNNQRAKAVVSYTAPGGKRMVGCYAFPGDIRWGIIAEIEEKQAYLAVGKMLQTLIYWFLLGVGIAVIGGVIFSRQMSKPIVRMSKMAERISGGDFDVDTEYKADDAIGVLGRTLVNMSRSLKASFSKIEEQNRQLQDYNRTLEDKVEQRTIELKDKNTALEETLRKLQETQNQLIMQQKLASLGQLTAGIAHEIKNPLNFVNNFAKLSVGLVDELREEIERAKDEPAQADYGLIEEIFSDIKTNVTKINEHGSRADSIVKGMLQHSRTDQGQMQETDLNAFLEESVNLAYHGMRSQTASFNTRIEKELDESIGRLNLNPQAFSQVLLNIINNSFYATHKRKQAQGADFDPALRVTTKDIGKQVEIRIRDNGTGIPASIREKIFEPFFTTKPTGEGTGLGLSLSYDIVVQMHKGEMQVTSEEGSFTEFLIRIPKGLS